MRSRLFVRNILVFMALICAGSAIATAQTTIETYTYSYTGKPLAILRDSADVITLAGITVPRSIKIQDVKVTVDIDYPRVSDLNVYFYSPEWTRTVLLERNCGDKNSLRRTTFDDAAPNKYSEFCPTEPGRTLRGNEPLGNSRDQNAAGIWTLAVENNGSDDYVGWILGFSVTITGEVYSSPTTNSELVVNSAGLIGGGVAPGELISIFGLNLGPSTPAEAPAGDLPLTLGGTSVTFNDMQAPIKYASKYRVDVQAPYGLVAGGDTWLTITSGAGTSTPVNVRVTTAQPGLFALNPSGLGQLDAVNADGSLNKNEAAARGSEITVYASGLGPVEPPIPDGALPQINPAPSPVYPVSASVGGVPATVVGARLTTDRPGVFQVRILIPTSIPAGAADVKISSASASSQNGAFIRVR